MKIALKYTWKEKMITSTNKQQESDAKAKICYICKESSKINTVMIKIS